METKKLLDYAREICRWHHERWDGEGYPDGIKGEAIPIAAQVVSIAECYDALTSERAYKGAYGHYKAIDMIVKGECGGFNPILMECVREVAEDAKQEIVISTMPEKIEPTASKAIVRKLTDEPVETGKTCILEQLEGERSKKDFFKAITDEILFEYYEDPESLVLSRKAAQMTSLPEISDNPFENSDEINPFAAETKKIVDDLVENLSVEEAYVEREVQLTYQNEKRWYRLYMQIDWGAKASGKPVSIFGKILDINDGYNLLNQIEKEQRESLNNKKNNNELVDLFDHITKDGTLSLSHHQASMLMYYLKGMFSFVRLVDPEICMQLALDAKGRLVERPEQCSDLCNGQRRNEGCISQIVANTRKPVSKLKYINNEIYNVSASYLEVDGRPYVIELGARIDDEILFSSNEKEALLNTVIASNRQLYVDALTGIYNRRYYDDKLRELEGKFTFAMVDVDFFKEGNDTYGHQAGDLALRGVARAIKLSIDREDIVVRYGGDEFFVILKDNNEKDIADKLEAVRCAVESIRIPEYPEMRLTVSIGADCEDGKVHDISRRADLAMYRAKKTKNSVVIFSKESFEA